VDRLLDEVSEEDFRDYQRLLSARPPVAKRLEHMLAQVCYVLASIHSSGNKQFSREDFLLFEGRRRGRAMTTEQMVAAARMMAAQSDALMRARK